MAATIRAALAGRSGHATLVRGAPALRREIGPFEPQPPALRAADRAGQAQLRSQGRAQSRPDVCRASDLRHPPASRFKRARPAPGPHQPRPAHAAPISRPSMPVLPQDPDRPAREGADRGAGRDPALGTPRRAAAPQPGLGGAGAGRRRFTSSATARRSPTISRRPIRRRRCSALARHSATRPAGWSPGSTPSSPAR